MIENRNQIVLIEDSESSYRLIRTVLRNEYDLHWIQDVEDKSQFGNINQSPDLFIMDIGLPEREMGFSVLETLNYRFPSVPKVIITCYSDATTAVRSFKLGAVDYIQKPFDAADFKNRVNQVIQHNSNMRADVSQYSYA